MYDLIVLGGGPAGLAAFRHSFGEGIKAGLCAHAYLTEQPFEVREVAGEWC